MQVALDNVPIGIKRLAISYNPIWGFPSHCPTHFCLSRLSLWFPPEILFVVWEGLLHIDSHYLCRVGGHSHTQHFLYASRAPELSHSAFPYYPWTFPSLGAVTGNLCWPPGVTAWALSGCQIFRSYLAYNLKPWHTRCPRAPLHLARVTWFYTKAQKVSYSVWIS